MTEVKITTYPARSKIDIPYGDKVITLDGFIDDEAMAYVAKLLQLGYMAQNLEFEAKKK
jgi:hypothetical protein